MAIDSNHHGACYRSHCGRRRFGRPAGPRSLEIVLEEGELQSVQVAPAGTVTLTRTRSYLKIESADANPGYSSQVLVAEAAGQYVKARLHR